MIKLTAVLVLVFTAVGAAVFQVTSDGVAAVSCITGGLFIFVNLLSLAWVWGHVLARKSIALAYLAILLKYLVLAYLFWYFSKSGWIQPKGFILGLSTLIFAILSMTVIRIFVRKTAK